jgi:hypothetical protein
VLFDTKAFIDGDLDVVEIPFNVDALELTCVVTVI